jgi:DnaJ-class molecular chaperone
MAKLKLKQVRRHICPTCKGNGFIKIINAEDRESYVHQCWDCDSEGEFYETVESDNLIGDTDDDGDYSNKLH